MYSGIKLPVRARNTVLIRFFLYFLMVILLTLTTISYFLYNYFSSLFKDEVLSLNNRILSQVSDFSDAFILKNMNELAAGISMPYPHETFISQFFSDSDEDYWKVILTTRNKLDSLIFQNRDIVDSIYLYSKDKKLALSQKVMKYIDEKEARNLDEFSWINQASMSNSSVIWLNTRIAKIYGSQSADNGNIITLICTYPVSSRPQDAKGYVAVNIREEALNNHLVKYNSTKLGHLLIVDKNGSIISHSDKSKLYNDISKERFVKEIMLSEKPKSFQSKFENTDYIISFKQSAYNNWYYVAMVPTELLYQKDYHIKRKIFAASITIFFIVLLVSNVFTYKMYKPLKKLLDKFASTINSEKKGKLDEYLMLENAFTDMSLKIDNLEDTLCKNVDMIVHNYLIDLLNKPSIDNPNIGTTLNSLGVAFSEKYFTVIIFNISKAVVDLHKQTDIQLCKYKIFEYIKMVDSTNTDNSYIDMDKGTDTNTKPICRYYPIDTDSRTISVIVNSNINDLALVRNFITHTQFHCYNNFGFYLTVGVGKYFDNLLSVRQSNIDAKIAILYKFLHPGQNEFYYEEISRKPANPEVLNQDYMEKLFKSLKLCNITEVNNILDTRISTISSNNFNYQYIKKEISQLRKLYIECFEEMSVKIDSNSEIKDIFFYPGDVFEFFDACKVISNKFIDYMKEKRTSKTSELIESVELYVLNNINGNLSLNLVADSLRISPQHLSKIFKEEKGINFIDYVTDKKIDKAKNLLSTTNMSLDEISVCVGYSHATYFSRKFKESTGYTPGEYRQQEVKKQLK
ncbi:MAG TPA: AraC family transcriptional regulator [Clostridiales bacterium]|nr:AraC family transcriptional regulator [Clostridiales bacterium]